MFCTVRRRSRFLILKERALARVSKDEAELAGPSFEMRPSSWAATLRDALLRGLLRVREAAKEGAPEDEGGRSSAGDGFAALDPSYELRVG
jgi:hypothetical protein